MTPAQADLQSLEAWLKQFGSVLVAYSGGVDSALLMAAAARALGDKALACIGVSESYPERERRDAVDLARRFHANLREIPTAELEDPRYAANPVDRCYYCKSELFDRLVQLAHAEGYAVVLDGNNASDVGDDRPGHTAAVQRGVRSPLMELGLTKDRVRAMAKALDMPVWDKPAMACLSSRVPHGVAIVPALLQKIEHAEDVLASLGFRQYRVRHHGDIARVELPPADLPKALDHRDALVAGIKAAGYKFVTLDLAGFKSGGLHEATKG